MGKKDFYDPTTAEYINPQKQRRVVIISGANSGIGYYTALHLYLHGYVVYIAGRTELKVKTAINQLEAEAKSRVEKYTEEEKDGRFLGSFKFLYIDLLDLSTVVGAAEEFGKLESKLHILINNAGIMGVPNTISKDGYEIQYQVNFVSHFLFTFKLLPYLKNVIDEGLTPRVVTLSSMLHHVSRKYYHPTTSFDAFPNFYYSLLRYGNAKAAAIEFMKKFAVEYPEIQSASIHPGVILETELLSSWKKVPILGYLTKGLFWLLGKFVGVSLEEGSLATLRAALDPQLTLKDSGTFYIDGGVVDTPSAVTTNQDNINTTWNWNIEELEKKGFLTASEI